MKLSKSTFYYVVHYFCIYPLMILCPKCSLMLMFEYRDLSGRVSLRLHIMKLMMTQFKEDLEEATLIV